jgi:hypothetical protein
MGMPVTLQLCGKILLIRKKSPLWKKHLIKQCFKLYFSDPELIMYNKYLWTISKVTTHRYWTFYLFQYSSTLCYPDHSNFHYFVLIFRAEVLYSSLQWASMLQKNLKVLGILLFLVFYVHIMIHIFLLSLWYTISLILFTYY